MKKFVYAMCVITLLINFTIIPNTRSAENVEPYIIGETFTIHSQILDEERSILIAKPLNYDNSDDTYPVLYVIDGEALFHYVSGLVQFLSGASQIPPVIVAAVVNTDRRRDLLPKIEHADNFVKFFNDELIPAIDSTYRTNGYRIISGHSWGAIFSLYSLISSPDTMNAYIVSSPWLNGEMRYICDEAGPFVDSIEDLDRFIYLTIGHEPEFLPGIGIFAQIFEERSFESLDWHFNQLPREIHETIYIPTLYQGLLTLYRDWQSPETTDQ